jgi:O-antigen ligase
MAGSTATATPRSDTADTASPARDRRLLGSLVFLGLFLFYAISTTPFYDLTLPASASIDTNNSSKLNQILFLALPSLSLIGALITSMRGRLLEPRWLLAIIFIWLVFTGILSNHSFNSLKALFLTTLVVVSANACLLLPRSDAHFAKLLSVGILCSIGLCYYGIRFLPNLSIHSAQDVAEPMLAGAWRGYFAHKNDAAAAMVLFSFCGLYIFRVWSRAVGVLILATAVFFLAHTGGKTATAMLPAVVLVAFVVERFAWTRIPIAFGGVGALNLLAVGSAMSPGLAGIVRSLGIDPTFTNRSDIWRLATNAISHSPIFGYGQKAFWRTEELVYGGEGLETWAVQASHAHNSYVEMILIGGFPLLFLSLIWFFIYPLRSLARIDRAGGMSHTGRLFLRIWLYMIFTTCLESLLYESSSGYLMGWFMFCMSLFGLNYEASADHIEREPAR